MKSLPARRGGAVLALLALSLAPFAQAAPQAGSTREIRRDRDQGLVDADPEPALDVASGGVLRVRAPGGRSRAAVAVRQRRVLEGVPGFQLTVPDGVAPQAWAGSFVRAEAAALALDPAFETTFVEKADGRRVHVGLRLGGIEVDGARGILVFTAGRLERAVFDLPVSAAVAGAFVLDQAAAESRAAAELARLRQARGLGVAPSWQDALSARRYLPRAEGLVPCWLVELRSAAPGEAYALFLNAATGAVEEVRDLLHKGTGYYPYGGYLNPFPTGSTAARVYKDQAAALAGSSSLRKLVQVSKGVPSIAAKGYVITGHADTWDANGGHAFSSSLDFDWAPLGADADDFDQANTAYQVERFAKHVKKAAQGPLASDFALPILLNVPSSVPNAFFSPTLFPPDGHTVGYLAFYDLTGVYGQAADISRDPTVVDHEYTHAWLAFEGLDFWGALDVPARAVNEAVADFFAATHHGDTVIGRYAQSVFTGYDVQRDLQDGDHFPEITVAAMAVSSTGLPEEHMNGEIFGSFLVDVARSMGGRTAERLLYQAFPAMPHDMASVGFPSVTPGNSVAATETFFHECVLEFRLAAESNKQVGIIVGAAAARGLQNTPTSTWSTVIDLETVAKRKFTFRSGVVRAGAAQTFWIMANQGRALKVTVKGAAGSGLLPDFTVAPYSGNPGGVAFPNPKESSDGGRVVLQRGIELNDAGHAYYTVTVSGQGGSTGSYTLTVDA